jgi:DNA-binding CsgD family transcriptional regulator
MRGVLRSRQGLPESWLVLGAVSVVSVLVALGAARGVWVSNLHNGVLAVTFTLGGALLLSRRPGHPEARLFLVAGVVSAVLYSGRQVGLDSSRAADAWWGWFGVWPTAVAIAVTTWLLLTFPEGRFLAPVWRRLAIAGATAAGFFALLSALWPVEYPAAEVTTPFPFTIPGESAAAGVWDLLAHPTYTALQLLWLVGLAARWRASDSAVRRQLLWLVAVVGFVLVVFFGGVVVTGSPTPGRLAVGLVPLVAGWLLYRLSLAHVVEVERAAGRLEQLTPRENDVLDLMAQGLSNAAIAERLHLSVKTVEPAISSIFRKLGLPDDPASNRRVLAVAEYWARRPSAAG